jgi:hypothetical protein
LKAHSPSGRRARTNQVNLLIFISYALSLYIKITSKQLKLSSKSIQQKEIQKKPKLSDHERGMQKAKQLGELLAKRRPAKPGEMNSRGVLVKRKGTGQYDNVEDIGGKEKRLRKERNEEIKQKRDAERAAASVAAAQNANIATRGAVAPPSAHKKLHIPQMHSLACKLGHILSQKEIHDKYDKGGGHIFSARELKSLLKKHKMHDLWTDTVNLLYGDGDDVDDEKVSHEIQRLAGQMNQKASLFGKAVALSLHASGLSGKGIHLLQNVVGGSVSDRTLKRVKSELVERRELDVKIFVAEAIREKRRLVVCVDDYGICYNIRTKNTTERVNMTSFVLWHGEKGSATSPEVIKINYGKDGNGETFFLKPSDNVASSASNSNQTSSRSNNQRKMRHKKSDRRNHSKEKLEFIDVDGVRREFEISLGEEFDNVHVPIFGNYWQAEQELDRAFCETMKVGFIDFIQCRRGQNMNFEKMLREKQYCNDVMEEHDYQALARPMQRNTILVNLYDKNLSEAETLEFMGKEIVRVLGDYLKTYHIYFPGDTPVNYYFQRLVRKHLRDNGPDSSAAHTNLIRNAVVVIGPLHLSLNFMDEIWEYFFPIFALITPKKAKKIVKPWKKRNYMLLALGGWLNIREDVFRALTQHQRRYPEIATFMWLFESLLPAALSMYSIFFRQARHEEWLASIRVFLIAVIVFRRRHYNKSVPAFLVQMHYWQEFGFWETYKKTFNENDERLVEMFHSLLHHAMMRNADKSAEAHQRAAMEITSSAVRDTNSLVQPLNIHRYSTEVISHRQKITSEVLLKLIFKIIENGDASKKIISNTKKFKGEADDNWTYKHIQWTLPNLFPDTKVDSRSMAPAYSSFIGARHNFKVLPGVQGGDCDYCGRQTEKFEVYACGHFFCSDPKCLRPNASNEENKMDCDLCFAFFQKTLHELCRFITATYDGDHDDGEVRLHNNNLNNNDDENNDEQDEEMKENDLAATRMDLGEFVNRTKALRGQAQSASRKGRKRKR